MTRHHLNAIVASLATLTALSAAPCASAQTAASASDVRPAAPERFKNYLQATVGPLVLLETVAWAGISQESNTPSEWGRDAKRVREAIRVHRRPGRHPGIGDLRTVGGEGGGQPVPQEPRTWVRAARRGRDAPVGDVPPRQRQPRRVGAA